MVEEQAAVELSDVVVRRRRKNKIPPELKFSAPTLTVKSEQAAAASSSSAVEIPLLYLTGVKGEAGEEDAREGLNRIAITLDSLRYKPSIARLIGAEILPRANKAAYLEILKFGFTPFLITCIDPERDERPQLEEIEIARKELCVYCEITRRTAQEPFQDRVFVAFVKKAYFDGATGGIPLECLERDTHLLISRGARIAKEAEEIGVLNFQISAANDYHVSTVRAIEENRESSADIVDAVSEAQKNLVTASRDGIAATDGRSNLIVDWCNILWTRRKYKFTAAVKIQAEDGTLVRAPADRLKLKHSDNAPGQAQFERT